MRCAKLFFVKFFLPFRKSLATFSFLYRIFVTKPQTLIPQTTMHLPIRNNPTTPTKRKLWPSFPKPSTVLAALLLTAVGSLPYQASAATVSYNNFATNFVTTSEGNGGSAGSFLAGGGTGTIGTYANGNTNARVAVYRDFTTSASGTQTARQLQIGDVFRVGIDMNGPITSGYYNGFGVFLLDGTSRNNNQTVGPGAGLSEMTNVAGAVRIDATSADFYAIGGNGTASSTWTTQTTAVSYASIDRFIEFKLTSSNSMNVTIYSDIGYTNALGRAMNVTLNNTGGIDSFALANRSGQTSGALDSFFFGMQVQDTGTVELGYFATTGTTVTPGLIANGLSADSTSVVRTNSVFVGGDAGSVVILNQDNTYTGASTVNSNATARVATNNAFGTTAGGVSVSSGGRIQLSNNVTVGSEALTINGTGISDSGALQSVSGSNQWQGAIALDSTAHLGAASGAQLTVSNVSAGANTLGVVGAGTTTIAGNVSSSGANQFFKTNTGTAILSGSNTFAGTKFIREGTVVLSNNSAMGGSGDIFLGALDGSAAATLRLGENITNSTLIDVNGVGTGIRTLDYQTASGTGAQLGDIKLVNSSLAFNIANGGTVLFGGGLTASTGGSDANRLAIDGGGTLIVTNNGAGISASDRYQVRIGNGTMVIGSGTIIARTNFTGSGVIGHAVDLGVDLNNLIVNNVSTLRASNSVIVSNSIYVSTTNNQARVIGASGANSAVTFSGPIGLRDAALTVNSTNGQSVTVTGAVTNFVLDGTNYTGSLIKTGTGTATFSGGSANTYSGTTTVSEGTLNLNKTAGVNAIAGSSITITNGATLLLSASNQVVDTASVTLSGGTIQRGSGVTETFGNLNLTAASVINFGTGTTNSLNFGTYAGGGFKLNVTNFLVGNILTFKTDLSGSITNTSLFGFDNGFNSAWNGGTSTFTITAIPEPSTVAAAVGLAAVFLWPARRRLVRDARSILGLRAPTRDRLASRHDHA
jgi:autotransporter-associated beta strand protein